MTPLSIAHTMSPAQAPLSPSGPAARLLSRPCGAWRVPHGLGVPGHFAHVPYRVLARVSVMDGYAARASCQEINA